MSCELDALDMFAIGGSVCRLTLLASMIYDTDLQGLVTDNKQELISKPMTQELNLSRENSEIDDNIRMLPIISHPR